MGTARATGYLRENDSGLELVFEREFALPRDRVWEMVTASEQLAHWIGTWEGDAREGGTLTFTMNAEESAAPEQVAILECEPQRRLQLELASEAGAWHLELDLIEVGGVTTLEFSHLLDQGDDVTTIGPGWDYYLDRLVAAVGSHPMPAWDDYYPALVGHYGELG